MSEQSSTRFDPEVSPVLIALLKGVIYREGELNLWTTLLRLRAEVGEFGLALGLTLQVDETEGFAFLRSPANDAAEEEQPLPRLVPRRQLTYYDSLLLALLRRKLAEFDASGTENRLVLRVDQLFDLAALFLPEHTDEVRLRVRIGTSVERLREYGFLRKLKSTGSEDTFEVMRILKAFVDAQWLGGLERGLAAYREHGLERETASND